MFLYTNVTLVDTDNELNQKLAPIAFRKSDIISFRGFIDDEPNPRYKRHGAITMTNGYEVHVTSSFQEIKNQIDPDSNDGGIFKEVDSPPPVLKVGQ